MAENKRAPSSVDIHVGARVRLRRRFCRMTQDQLAQALGTTFQQVQKYEKGANRICAGRLWRAAQALDVPVAYFFDGLAPGSESPLASTNEAQRRPEDPETALVEDDEVTELARSYRRLTNPDERQAVLTLLRGLAPRSTPTQAGHRRPS